MPKLVPKDLAVDTSNTNDTRFKCLCVFTIGKVCVVGDHRFEPVAHGVVRYTYRDKPSTEIDIVEAAKSAGTIIDHHIAWGAI